VIFLFCGSRDWTDREPIYQDIELIASNDPDAIIIHGGCRGADTIAGEAAASCGLHTAVVDPRWDHFGRGAGRRRNAAMLRLRPDVVYAYPLTSSAGTWITINLAREAGIRVVVDGATASGQPIGHSGNLRIKSDGLVAESFAEGDE
jgi:hypothetical protein